MPYYYVRDAAELSGSAVADYLFDCPSEPVQTIGTFASTGTTLFELFEDTVTSDDGTPSAPQAADRNTPHPSTMGVFTAPTVIDTGPKIWVAVSMPGTAREFSPLPGWEVLSKPNTKYLWRVSKITIQPQWYDFSFWWFEGESAT